MAYFVDWDKQGKHILEHNNYIEGRSILSADPEMLVSLYAGKSKRQIDNGGNFKNRETFIHSDEIGIWKDEQGRCSETNRGTIHYSKKGVHIVPSRPDKEEIK